MEQEAKPQVITDEQHSDFIWTWKSNQRGSKASIWMPYFSEAKRIPRSKKWSMVYNGGELEVDFSQVDFIMFYGATGELPISFLDDAAQNGVIIMIHRRNIANPYFFLPSTYADQDDLLSQQIRIRSHDQKRTYIAKVLIRERFSKMASTIPIPPSLKKTLASLKTVEEVRNLEAQTTARFWDKWYSNLGIEASRRADHPVNTALDAGSKFIAGVILRWLVFHKFSPCHGFLHEPTTYPSLIYDLIEPYRYIIEDAAAKAWSNSDKTEKSLVALTLSYIKEDLEELCFVPQTRQYVRRKNLLHGIVLALRTYLLGEMKKFVIPVEGIPNGGRPPKVGYKLPGSVYDCNRKRPEIKSRDSVRHCPAQCSPNRGAEPTDGSSD